MKKTYSVTIIGLGNIGMLYDYNSKDDICLTHLKSFSLNPSFNIINCIDKSSDKILMAKKKYGTSINYFNSFSSDIPKTDIYVLCALSNEHRRLRRISDGAPTWEVVFLVVQRRVQIQWVAAGVRAYHWHASERCKT